MSHRFLASVGAAAFLAMSVVTAQTPAANAKNATAYAAPRTAWGDPDLQGTYTFATETPLQRPAALGDKDTYTEAELKKLEQQVKDKHEENIATNEHFSYNALWFVGDQGRPTGRTSLIVDPENGRMPPLTEHGEELRKQNAARLAARRAAINSWADHSNYDQCVSRPMPRVSQEYNQGVEILQTPKDVTIFYESMHDTRIIPLDGSPHLDASLRQWNGDSRGHWEGNTLVVDSTNFTDKQRADDSAPFGGFPQGNMRFTERFTRVDKDTIMYQVTVTDLTIWIKPWTFVLPWRSDDPAYKGPEDLFEYACHEGNYRMIEDTITGSRATKAPPK
jgi:hypothetical protein